MRLLVRMSFWKGKDIHSGLAYAVRVSSLVLSILVGEDLQNTGVGPQKHNVGEACPMHSYQQPCMLHQPDGRWEAHLTQVHCNHPTPACLENVRRLSTRVYLQEIPSSACQDLRFLGCSYYYYSYNRAWTEPVKQQPVDSCKGRYREVTDTHWVVFYGPQPSKVISTRKKEYCADGGLISARPAAANFLAIFTWVTSPLQKF